MATNESVSPFLPFRNATTFKTTDGREIQANLTDSPILVGEPQLESVRGLVARFREIHLRWLLDHLCEEAEAGYHEGPRESAPLYGLAYTRRQRTGLGQTCVLRHLRAARLADGAWAACGLSGAPKGKRLDALIGGGIPHELQRAMLTAAIGYTAESAARVLKNPDVLVFPDLESILERSESATAFFETVASLAASEPLRDEPAEKSRSGAYTVFLPSAFMFFAAQEGFALLSPQRRIFSGGHGRKELYMRLAGAHTLDLACLLRRDGPAATEKPAAGASSLPLTHSPLTALLTMTSCSTMRSKRDISVGLFTKVRDVADRLVVNHGRDHYRSVFCALNEARGPADRLPENLPTRNADGRALGQAFGWTRMTRGSAPDKNFPKTAPADYAARLDIIEWAVMFERYLGAKDSKAFAPIQSSLQCFLVWLHESGVVAHDFFGLERAHINDNYSDPSASKCFRAHIERMPSKPKTKNVILSNVASAFDWSIAERGLATTNPIHRERDAFKTGQARGRTVRNCIPREVAELLKETNRRDDFALSRSLKKHMRKPASGGGKSEWFPGVALLIDLLLCLPLRGFQGRFLDSGEGDDLIPVRGPDGTLELRPNTAETRVRGRNEGCLDYIPPSVNGTPALGLYINTNKTSEIENAGYKIPWCPPELEANIRRMAQWQSERNPVKEPTPCMDKTDFKRHMNRSVANSVKKTFALFRDPDDNEGWPISRKAVYEYWDLLLARVEEELAKKGRPMRLTEEVKRDGKTVRKGVFDIHSLRVTGITALLEAGLSPEMVRDVAGHSTIVMTLYYNKVENDRLARAMDAAMRRISETIEEGGRTSPEMEMLGLFNMRNGEDSAGMELLLERQGRGPGGVSVMSHGICPGGDCSTGGAFDQSSRGHGQVAPGACSLCRYRLTGPAFLSGLVLNANRIMFNLHTAAKELSETNEELARADLPPSSASRLRGSVELLTRQTDALAKEWAAEIQYAQMAMDMLDETPEGKTLALIGNKGLLLAKRPAFVLLQKLAEGHEEVVDFRPIAAIERHRLFLSELLTATNAGPFLLSLPPKLRDKASVQLGKAICNLLPDNTLYGLSDGTMQPNEEIQRLADSVKSHALSLRLDRIGHETDNDEQGGGP